ncbi:hypothetical protein I3843_10G078000 [Carya illinoinensis]|nr:hypothetical protein I3843_10G078000 [Carya illinoinensis]
MYCSDSGKQRQPWVRSVRNSRYGQLEQSWFHRVKLQYGFKHHIISRNRSPKTPQLSSLFSSNHIHPLHSSPPLNIVISVRRRPFVAAPIYCCSTLRPDLHALTGTSPLCTVFYG